MTDADLAYRALALQTACHAVNQCPDRASARVRMNDSIARIGRQIRAAKGFLGQDVRLVVLPEYFLTGYPLGESIPEWADKAALAPDGAEYEALARIAQDNTIYLSGNVYETDAAFPGLYFQASFVIDPAGATVLRYRRLVSMFAPTPHDVWDRYLELYGLDGVFPVANTTLGRLAAVASEEILYPEIARALALRGAEVLLHSTSEVGSPRLTPKDIAKRARAVENLAYLVSANTGGFLGSDLPEHSTDGMSKIVGFLGEVHVEAGYGESSVACAEIDIAALRRYRRRPGMANLLSRQRLEIFAPVYGGAPIHPANGLIGPDGRIFVPDRAHFTAVQRKVIERLAASGLV
jgi:predicted amidohydrolase